MDERKVTWRRGFWSLIATQFQGAFNDNALKFLVIFLILGMPLPVSQREALVPLVGVLFALPFILFSMLGGYLADRFSKRQVTVGTKMLEISVMLIVLAGLALDSLPLLLLAVFANSTQAALFSPSKYSLLPELLPEQRLSWGNGVIELATFAAIIGGTAAGIHLAELTGTRQWWPGVLLLSLAVVGFVLSLGITQVPAADPGKRHNPNFVGELWRQLALVSRDRVLALAVLGNSYFFFLGALLQFNIVVYGAEVLKLGATQNNLLQAALAIGIGLGSFAAGYLSGGKIEYGLVPLGAVGVSIFAASLFVEARSFAAITTLLALLGFFGGLFIVPIAALLQHRPARERKGGVLAASSLVSWIAILLASLTYYAATAERLSLPGGLALPLAHLDSRAVFLATALLTLASTAYALLLLPSSFLRLLLWLLTHSVYRIRVEGRDNIPERGGALFVCNHLSFVDALLLTASTDRLIRFMIYQGIYDHPVVKPFARVMRAIPISSELRPRDLIRSLREASQAVRDGEVVCIFAEGQITRIGQLLPFRRGFTRIMKGVDAPIIPVALDGVWGSIFSFERGRFLWKVPRCIPYPVTVSFGRPMPAGSSAFAVRQAVRDLQAESWCRRREALQPLQRAFVRAARRHPLRFAMADGRVPVLRSGSALARAIFLARRLRREWEGQEMVGILLPPSVAGALVNLAALLLGKVPVNLNYTASNQVLEECARQCNLRSVVTSREFLERVKAQPPARAVLLEGAAANPGVGERLAALALTWLAPVALLERALGGRAAGLDDLATVIFSSGSTGSPKGVMLTHANVAANVEQIGQVFMLGGHDRVMGVLPFFHSFGFTGTLCLPVALGTGVVYHPNPLDARAIGALVRQYAATFLLATPTFLQAYLRRCQSEDFGSLQYVMAGAEKLPERLALAFEDTFGIRPLEGYGCTECSPVVSVNGRQFRAPGFRQVGARRGTIGHPLPGISVRIVDPDTGAPLPPGQPGMLLVRGPNVMKGYLGQPEMTAAVLRDGWYTTGDIACEDEDGFLTITDRLSRFSKIGGEMVPHGRLEEALQQLAGATEQRFAVTGLPDPRRGERLVVLHTLPDEQLRPVLDRLLQSGLPALWLPRPNQFFHVAALPYLGTGKLDLRRVREIAQQLAGNLVGA